MTSGACAGPLAGRGIVITRPAEQAAGLIELVRVRGGRPILFPAIEIQDPADFSSLRELVGRLASFDLAIFVSPSAVARAMTVITAAGALPPGLSLAVVGPGSARELHRYTDAPVLVPRARFDSEGLLELEELKAVAGKRVVIFRGEGGRERLGGSLSARGARVEYAPCYRRGKPDIDARPLLAAWNRGAVDAFIVTSSEGLRNLAELLGEAGRGALCAAPVFVSHSRIARTADELRLQNVIEAAPGDDAMMACVCRYFEARAAS